MIGALRARIGEAKIVVARGNLPAADVILSDAVALATKHDLIEVRSMATHDRAYIAHTRGQYDLAVRLAYDAMRDSVSESERDRILNDLAGSFYMLGVKSAARDAFLILAATAREQYQRWAATINLMELAAEDGLSLQFERYRQQLGNASLPPILRTQYELHVGRGYQQFGSVESARAWLERALATATAHSFNRFIFAAEAALEHSSTKKHTETAAFVPGLSYDVERIASELKVLRQTVHIK
jgi:ATP/maltotriose-dependent transcriptional regulator MalT